jgi:hypothetical protein
MKNKKIFYSTLLVVYILMLAINTAKACSMYKITINGKTVVGCNEDAWRTTPRVWFETAKLSSEYGAAFTGSRFDGGNGFAPQSGMNEAGLSFSRLQSYMPEYKTYNRHGKKNITNPTNLLKEILHRCKNVEEVKLYIEQYDYSFFMEDVFIYIDQTGKYLVVEPYKATIGYEASYVLSNFCPSITTENKARNLDRYRNGVDFLKLKKDTTLSFYTALSDTMHVCRGKIGDGTLLTSIWNLNNKTFTLYFYHDYSHLVEFNLKNELAKGDHIIEIPTLFPVNEEFIKLHNYKIPKNSLTVMFFIIIAGLLFLFSSLFFLVNYFKTKQKNKYGYFKLIFVPFGIIMFYYMFLLATQKYIFYFPAPYKDPNSTINSIASYLPILLLLLIFPIIYLCLKIFKEKAWGRFAKWLFALNIVIYSVLILFFAYWELLNVF